jgi:hypothetical protein
LASFSVFILIAITNDMTGGRVNVFFFLMAVSGRVNAFRVRIPVNNDEFLPQNIKI